MRFLLVTREFPPHVLGGVAYHSYYLARNLIDEGHDVHVLTTNSQNSKDNSNFKTEEIVFHRLSTPKILSERLWFNLKVRKFLKNTNTEFDVVHSHDFIDFTGLELNSATVLKIHSHLLKKPQIQEKSQYGILNPLAMTFARKILWPVECKLEKKSLDSADKIIFNSELSKKIYKQEYTDFHLNQNEIIHNGVDPDKFQEDSKEKGYFLFVGGSSKRKGSKIVFEAFEDLDKNVKILGEVEEIKSIENENIELLGRADQEDLINYYQEAAALIHPATYEPFGNVVLESLSCGTPVIISNEKYCGAAEILDENVSKKIEPDVEPLKKTIKEAENWEVEAERCREVAEEYTWKRVAEETIDFVD
jgi:glycosyltransferase involved in cell wall biosynthesis